MVTSLAWLLSTPATSCRAFELPRPRAHQGRGGALVDGADGGWWFSDSLGRMTESPHDRRTPPVGSTPDTVPA